MTGEDGLLIGFLLAIFGLFFFFIYKIITVAFNRIRTSFSAIGEQYNLEVKLPASNWKWMNGDLPEARGNINGWPMHIYMETRGYGKNKTTYTNFQLDIDYKGEHTLWVSNDSIFAKMGKALMGTQDIIVGDPAFDETYVIRSNDKQFAKKILHPMLLGELKKTLKLSFGGRLELKNGKLYHESITMLNHDKTYNEFTQAIEGALLLAKEIKSQERY